MKMLYLPHLGMAALLSAVLPPLAQAAPFHAGECPLPQAIYTPVEDDSFGQYTGYELQHSRKKLRANQSHMVVTIRAPQQKDGKPARSYDFGFAFSNGYGRTSLVFAGESAKSATYRPPKNDEDDGPGSHIQYFDAELKEAAPHDGKYESSPAYLIMPEIGLNFWYWQGGDRTFVPSGGMWKRTACRK